MPTIDLGQVVGPQGPQGETGATGAQGAQGNPGPNQVTGSTATNLNGVLMGSGGTVGVRSVDSAPTNLSTNLITSGGVASAIANAVSAEIIVVNISAFNGSQTTYAAQGVTANHVVVESNLSNPAAQIGAWKVTTGANSVSISGSVNGSTNVQLKLARVGATVSGT